MYAPKSVDCGMDLKEKAAVHATQFVRSGTTIGLGSGSTMSFFIRVLGQRLRLGELREVLAVPTSEQTARQAHSAGIPLTTLDDHPHLDVAIDGADEVDANLNLIKGLGKALLREKVVAAHSHSFIIIVDVSKLVPRLGTRGPLLVELVPFAAGAQIRWFHTMGCRAEIWRDDDGVLRANPVVLAAKLHLEDACQYHYELVVLVVMQRSPGAVSDLRIGQAAGYSMLRAGQVPLPVVGPPRRLRCGTVVDYGHFRLPP